MSSQMAEIANALWFVRKRRRMRSLESRSTALYQFYIFHL